MAKCKNCGEEILWVKSKKTGTNYPVNVGKTTKDNDYFHSKTCKSLNKEQPKEEVAEQKQEEQPKQEVTILDVMNNHELRIRELEGIVSRMLQHFGMVYLENEKK